MNCFNCGGINLAISSYISLYLHTVAKLMSDYIRLNVVTFFFCYMLYFTCLTLLQSSTIKGVSKIVDDIKNILTSDVTQDSCISHFTEVVTPDRDRDFTYPVTEVKQEELQDITVESADENDNEDSQYFALVNYDFHVLRLWCMENI